jgi:hypothetical protein
MKRFFIPVIALVGLISSPVYFQAARKSDFPSNDSAPVPGETEGKESESLMDRFEQEFQMTKDPALENARLTNGFFSYRSQFHKAVSCINKKSLSSSRIVVLCPCKLHLYS